MDSDVDVAALAGRLRAEAASVDERRALVLAGDEAGTRERARATLDGAGIDREATTVVGPDPVVDCEHLTPVHSGDLLGRTREAVVLDCHAECRPNALGRAVGAVDGGGLLVLLTPPLAEWPDRRDAFDESLAVPPFDIADVGGAFRRRLVATLRAHPGIAVVDEGVERDGLTDPAPRLPREPPAVPTEGDRRFPAAAYERCRTDDQSAALRALEALADPETAVVVEADRGRGKSSAAGLAAGSLAAAGRDVLVTAPGYRGAREVLLRAAELLADTEALRDRDSGENPHELSTDDGRVRFADVETAAGAAADADVVIVDEAAALPVRTLERFLAAPAVAFATTVHGYEGAGRGFSVRFRDRLGATDRETTDVTMTEPIRYAAGDPVESWAFRALSLDARPAVDPLVADADPAAVRYRRLSTADLVADEHLIGELFGLLVLAHYRTEPDDLARLLDAPNVAVRALSHDGHVVSAALLAREGGLPADLRAEMYEGARVRGNMIPDVLTTQLRDEAAGVPVGWRVLRIATHPAVRSRGLGSRLLDEIRAEAGERGVPAPADGSDLGVGGSSGDADGPDSGLPDGAGRSADGPRTREPADWVGVGYGATPELVTFWAANGHRTVHVSTTRNAESGEYSAVMLDPLTDRGRALADRHARWFGERIGGVLSDPLDDLDPDVARAALRATDAATLAGAVGDERETGPEGDGAPPLVLSDRERRHLSGIGAGAATFDTDPTTVRRLALRHLLAPAADLDPRRERLLVRKALQGRPWDAVAAELEFVSTAECMRALGAAVERLMSLYVDGSTEP